MTTFVHFGMPKTGTSSIQASLDRLAVNRPTALVYIKGPGPNANRLVRTLFGKRSSAQDGGPGPTELAWKQVDDQSRDAGERPIVLSSEVLPGVPEPGLRRLRDVLASHGGPVRAVGYMRAPKAFMESVFQQRIKAGASSWNLDELYPQYRRRYEKFLSAFGAEHTSYWSYDPAAFPEGCVVRDFCGRVGIPIDPVDVLRVNEGLSLPALMLLYAYNRHSKVAYNPHRTNTALVAALATLPGPKLRFHSSIVRPIISQQQADIAWAEERTGKTLAEALESGDDHAILSEADLLTIRPEALEWLSQRIQGPLGRRVLGGEPTDVAAGMRNLIQQLAGSNSQPRRARPMTTTPQPAKAPAKKKAKGVKNPITEFVRKARGAEPALAALPEPESRKLALHVLREVRRAVATSAEGEVRIPGLGSFVVKAESAPEGGAPAGKTISFVPKAAAKPGAKAAAKSAAKVAAKAAAKPAPAAD